MEVDFVHLLTLLRPRTSHWSADWCWRCCDLAGKTMKSSSEPCFKENKLFMIKHTAFMAQVVSEN